MRPHFVMVDRILGGFSLVVFILFLTLIVKKNNKQRFIELFQPYMQFIEI